MNPDLIALMYILGQAILLWVMLKFVSSFGAFVASHVRAIKELRLTHESNLLVHKSNLVMLDKLTELHKKAVA